MVSQLLGRVGYGTGIVAILWEKIRDRTPEFEPVRLTYLLYFVGGVSLMAPSQLTESVRMKTYTIERVETPSQIKEFHDLPKRIYAGNRCWVQPLDIDIESRFDPERNELFYAGDAIRWILRASSGQVVGRIGAFYNKEVSSLNEQPTGGCGFFECINDQQAANQLFDAAKEWLIGQGMEAMDGPINFGDRDQWWGLLEEGFELQPLYGCSYNPPYYIDLFRNYGFENYFNQLTYLRHLHVGKFNPSVYDKVKRLEEMPEYEFSNLVGKDLSQVADDFRIIYNKAWAMIPGVKPMDREHAHKMMRRLKPIIDRKIIFFAYFNKEPIGFFIMVPDLNRVLGGMHGKLHWFNALRLLVLLKLSRKVDRVIGVTFGVVPEFQGKGIESGMMYAFEKLLKDNRVKRYKTLELMWIGDFNPVMMRVVESYVCAVRHKRHATYRYLFDRTKPFTRCPRMGGAKRKG